MLDVWAEVAMETAAGAEGASWWWWWRQACWGGQRSGVQSEPLCWGLGFPPILGVVLASVRNVKGDIIY